MSTVSLKKNDVPRYLHESEFYRSLNLDADEEISVPTECFKVKDCADSGAELLNLLSTLRFWGVKDCPASVTVCLLFDSDQQSKQVVAAEFEGELSYLVSLLHISKCPLEERLKMAIQYDNVTAVQCILGMNVEVDAGCFRKACETCSLSCLRFIIDSCEKEWLTTETIDATIKKGSLDVLIYLRDNGFDIAHPNVAITAAGRGHLHILQYYLDLEHPSIRIDDIARSAAHFGHLDCLTYACERGLFPMHLRYDIFNEVCEQGHLHVIQFLHHRGISYDEDSCWKAAQRGHLPVLQWLHEQGAELPLYACTDAARGGHLNCLQYLHKHGCTWHKHIFSVAAMSGQLNCLKYLLDNGCEADAATAMMDAISNDRYEVLKFLHEYGCPLHHSMCAAALKHNRLDYLKYLVEHGVSLSRVTTEEAAQRGHFACFKYAHEHGASWGESTCETAALYGQAECLQYALEHGCAWDVSVYKDASIYRNPAVCDVIAERLAKLVW